MKPVPGPVEGWTFERSSAGLMIAITESGDWSTCVGIDGGTLTVFTGRPEVRIPIAVVRALLADEALTVGQALADARVQGGTHVHQVDPPSRSPFQVAEFARSCATCAPPRSPMPSPDRCPRCDRAESECDRRAAHLAFNAIAKRYPNVRPGQTVAGEYDDALTRMCRADEDCKPVDWRAEALALRARLAADRPRVPLARRSDGWTLDVTPPDGSRVGVQQIPVDVRADFIASLDGGDRLASPPADTRTWSDGVRDAIKCVQGRRRIAEILAYVPAYFAALDEALVFLEAGLERGTMRSTGRVDGTDAPAASPPSLAPLRARAEALLAVVERASPQPWIQSGERRCIDTGRIDDRGDVCDGYSLAPVPNEYDPAEEWETDAPAIVALRNDAPALIRDLLAALGDNLPTKET